jgi:hypothetical protein
MVDCKRIKSYFWLKHEKELIEFWMCLIEIVTISFAFIMIFIVEPTLVLVIALFLVILEEAITNKITNKVDKQLKTFCFNRQEEEIITELSRIC